MTMFGLPESDVATLTRAVAGAELDRNGIRERFARAAWTGIAEPGDGVAGTLVGALGADAALDGFVSGWNAPRFAGELADAGEDGADAAAELSELDAPGPERVALERSIARALERWRPRLSGSQSLTALRQASRYGARLLTPDDEGWPQGVNDLQHHAPIALWCRGISDALAALDSSIALVGARAVTGYGEHVTMEASAGLVDRGYTIVSGAAYGVDGMAHRAALASNGLTVAFLAGGVDRFYPAGHDALLGQIVERGAVLSELPCGEPPTKWRFLQRNRLISAASLATVVLEAGWRSGSLNTAGHAGALGRPLGAVPGPVTSPASAGCHRLIREFDAVLVTNADEMAELAPLVPASTPAEHTPDRARQASAEVRVLDAVSSRSPRDTANIAARAGVSVAVAQSILGPLELDGVVTERDRGWVKRAR